MAKVKAKTNRAMAKRVRARKSGSLKRKHAYHSHILTKKTTKRCRRLRRIVEFDATSEKALRRMLPHID